LIDIFVYTFNASKISSIPYCSHVAFHAFFLAIVFTGLAVGFIVISTNNAPPNTPSKTTYTAFGTLAASTAF
jgi:hypothetical protein